MQCSTCDITIKITLLEKGLYYKHKNIQGENGFLFIQDPHVSYNIVQIFCIMAPLSWFYHVFYWSGKQCCPWASYFQVPLSFLDYFLFFHLSRFRKKTSKNKIVKYAINFNSYEVWLGLKLIFFNVHLLCL